ncbi:MAG: polysaccharide lyase family protein [Candidatus Dadabacteria bacterium]
MFLISQYRNCLLLLMVTFFNLLYAGAQPVMVKEDLHTITLNNSLLSITFNKGDANIIKINYNGTNLLNGGNQRGYLTGPSFSMGRSRFKILRKNEDLVEISFYHEGSNHFQYDLRYVLRKDYPGIYCYLVQSHHAGDSAGNYGQTRWGIRSDESLFDYHLVRDSIQGPMPSMAELDDEVQDWTYKMADGTVYTKYNYADYIDGRYVHGMAGRKSGLGIFVIQPSHEYLNGGPTKQYQNVHSSPFLICMFNCGHFLSDKRKADNIINGEWVKLDGPFLLYFNKRNDIPSIWTDAKQQAEKEIKQWPYKWMQDPNYPLLRGTVKGKLLIDGKAAGNAIIVLARPGYDWQAQSQDYIFSVHADGSGAFEIPNVRAGKYTLYAFGCNSTDEYRHDNIEVQQDKITNEGTLNWITKKNGELLWQIGEADRKTTGFQLADHKRDYGLFNLPPADLQYTVGGSKNKDWYYAQTKRGSWDIKFTCKKRYPDESLLTIGIAGSAKNPTLEIWVNGTKAGAYNFGNDASIYRSAVAGGYYYNLQVPFSSTLLNKGDNVISLRLPNVKQGGGIMYDVIKLEAK